jgi:16S rRNA (adenine1518-N6/adenine1519-N6)-dimethyltransferase
MSFESPKAQLARLGLAAKKQFGQNFLADSRIAARIAELCTTPPGGSVVELGAGLGALTGPLLARAGRVVAVERDRDLVPALEHQFEQARRSGQLQVLEADAKSVDVAEFLAGGPRPWVLAGNLPYQLTGPLLQLAVQQADPVDRVVYLVQLEVADRVCAAPGGDSWGALSVFLQARFEPKRELIVRRGVFVPQPRVDSAVLSLTPRAQPLARETATFRAAVKLAFAQRRKKLRNAWSSLGNAEVVAAAAQRAGIDLDARGETLAVEAFARMARELEA